jgi:Protein of unknown function (DUF1194)
MRTAFSQVFALVLALCATGAVPSQASPVKTAADRTTPAEVTVDLELVLAVDISYSMDPEEQALQREGYITALTSPEFLTALREGQHGRIVATYVEWAGTVEQRVIVPWQVIDGRASADAFARAIATAPYRRAYRTSISGALQFAMPLFESSGHRGLRRVIDVSGDGANNQGPMVTLARHEVLAKGITINGLPIVLKRPSPATMDIPDLDIYYEDCVIGGPAAFVIPIKDRDQFKEATRTKLVLEVAGRTPGSFSELRSLGGLETDRRQLPVRPASAAAPRVSCTIGEQLWQQRWGP